MTNYSRWFSIGVCIAYGVAGISVSLIYKTVLSSLHFEAAFLLLALQQLLGIIFCLFAQKCLRHISNLYVPPFSWNVYKQSISMGVAFVIYIGSSLIGLKLSNVPMYLCLRRTTTAFALLFEYLILGHVPTRNVIISIAVIVLGTIIAGWDTFSTDGTSYILVIFTNVVHAIYLNLNRRFCNKTEVRGFGLVYYNAITAFPLSVVIAGMLGELEYAASFPNLYESALLTGIGLSIVLGLSMTYIAMLCTSVNSPVVTSLTGNVRDVVYTFIGAILFGFEATYLNVTGLTISFIGAGMFVVAKTMKSSNSAMVRTSEEKKYTKLHTQESEEQDTSPKKTADQVDE